MFNFLICNPPVLLPTLLSLRPAFHSPASLYSLSILFSRCPPVSLSISNRTSPKTPLPLLVFPSSARPDSLLCQPSHHRYWVQCRPWARSCTLFLPTQLRQINHRVCTTSKGQTAKEDIVQSVKHRTDANAIEVWPLDLNSTESTLAFAGRVKKELPRVDALVENAGVNNDSTWLVSEGFEQTTQINVINTFLLALSLLPKLTETKAKFTYSSPHLVIVSSEFIE